MSIAPKIIHEWTQGGRSETTERARLHKEAVEAQLGARATAEGQEIVFFATTNDGASRTARALAGDTAPTVTGGRPKVGIVPRQGRMGYTNPEGWEPFTLTVPIKFEAFAETKSRPDIEAEILRLEWMTGRVPGEVPEGEPPYVEVITGSGGKPNALVPKQFQNATNNGQLYYMTDIAFDPNPLRDRGGARLRQDATVTLLEILNTPGTRAANEALLRSTSGYVVKYTTKAAPSMEKVLVREHIPKKFWGQVYAANRKLGSPEKHQKDHTAVRIPKTAFLRVPR